MKTQIKILLMLFFFTAVGICSGAFYEVYLQQSDKIVLESIVKQLIDYNTISNSQSGSITFWDSIFASAKSFIPFIIAGFFSSVLFPLLPLLPCYSVYKGFVTGFVSTLMIESLGAKGVLLIAKTLFIPTLLQIGSICYLSTLSLIYGKQFLSFLLMKRRKNVYCRKNSFSPNLKQYLVSYLIGTAVIIISFIYQAFLLSAGL